LNANRPLGRQWRRWEDDIKIYLKDIELESVDWIHMKSQRLVAGVCVKGNDHLSE
jgi:hypothetical protein